MGGRKGGSKLTQVRHSRGRGAGWVQCRGEQLVRSGHLVAVAVCDRGCERKWCSNYTFQILELLQNENIPAYRHEIGKLVYRSGNSIQNHNGR